MIEELIKKEAKRFEKSENWEKEVLQDVKEIGLSENQFKVISNKYLRGNTVKVFIAYHFKLIF